MTVYLVGAGPGDPGLLTLRGAELLAGADVVVHDRLADSAVLELVRPDVECIDVGKTPGLAGAQQEAINALLIERGRQGQAVVRLKGGDPFVFGRGGEEAEALLAAGVDFEVVPGITSAVAVPAYAGVPVTHRGLSRSFSVVTGHSRSLGAGGVDWDALARAGDTIVVLMGVGHRAAIASALQAAGRPPTTPVLAVQWGTRPEQRSVRTTLAELSRTTLESPAVLVIGPVAGLNMAWYERRPLLGCRVVVTRAPHQASSLAEQLRRVGAQPVAVPVIELADPSDEGAGLDRAARRLAGGAYQWVVFTSANAVDRLFSRLDDLRALGSSRLAVVGRATADALAAYHLRADLVPVRFVAEGLLEVFPAPSEPGTVLLPQAADARAVLADGLTARGWQVEVVEAYRTVPGQPSDGQLAAAAGADAICFTSSSTVTNYLAVAGPERVPPVVAAIGPVTAATARRHGLKVTVEATEHTIEGLVSVLVRAVGSHGS